MAVSSMSPLTPAHLLSKKESSSHSVEGLSGFKDALQSPKLMEKMIPLHHKNPVTEEDAMKAACNMMEAFYTQSFKTMFEEIRREEDNDFAIDMTKDIFVEQMGKAMGRNISSVHKKIAETLMKGETSQPKDGPGAEKDSATTTLQQTFDDVFWESINVTA